MNQVPPCGHVESVMSGFGNHFATEAVSGALPLGRNSPQNVPFGLYAEQLSGTAFTVPRAENRRSWLYRLRPSACHPRYHRYAGAPQLRSGPFEDAPADPNRLRWGPLPMPEAPTDFVDGLVTFAGNGDVGSAAGIGIHLYAANRSMVGRVFYSADGELLVVPQAGRLRLVTEMGVLELDTGAFGVIPRGIRFRAELPDGTAISHPIGTILGASTRSTRCHLIIPTQASSRCSRAHPTIPAPLTATLSFFRHAGRWRRTHFGHPGSTGTS